MSAGFLLDTNVVSEARRSRPDPHVAEWIRKHQYRLYVSVLVVGEITQGVERLRRRDREQAERHEAWLEAVVRLYRGRILPVSQDVAEEWGRVQARPDSPPKIDGLMAATAVVHGLTVVTRNAADFGRAGVPVVNPFGPVARNS
jgi:predicted nucleic acid-binding protein